MAYLGSSASVAKSSSASASSTSRFWSDESSDLRVTFSVASTVRSATSARICWIARRVSASMSRRVCCIISSRLVRASASVSASADSAVRRARETISSAWPRASESRARYSASSSSASRRVRSAASIESSIARWRLSSASAIRGKATFHRKNSVSPKTTSVHTMSPMSGLTRKLPPDSSAAIRVFIALLKEEGDQARDQPVEEARLGEREAEPLDRGDFIAHLRLARDRLDHLAEDDADAHTGANGAETAADTEGDRAASSLTILRRGEDEAENEAGDVHFAGLLLVGLGDRAAEIDGGQSGEDERLKRGDEADLEEIDRPAERQQEDADRGGAQQDRQTAGHEEDDQVPGQHVREQSDRERDDPHQVREHLEGEDQQHHRAVDAPGDQRLQIAADALGADALGRVGDEDHEREDERDREVRGRGVDLEGRDVGPEEVDLLLAVDRQRDEADQVRVPDEEEDRPDEREPLGGHAVVHVAAGDVVAHQPEEELDRGLDPVRPRVHPARDVEHRPHGEEPGEQQVQHRLVEVDRADREPGVQPELVLRLELGVLAGRPEEHGGADRKQQIDPTDPQHDLARVAHVLGVFLSIGRVMSWVAK